MGYYPLFLDMRGRPVLLVGGGHVALEKMKELASSEADVTILAPNLVAGLQAYVDSSRARLVPREFRDGDTAGYRVVMVATDNGAVNRAVAEEARGSGIWVNAADDVTNCDFILPSVARRGSITVATSTGGSSPALARWLRERMERFLSADVVALGEVLGDLRREARLRDRECASGCDRVGVPPPLLCAECPNRIAPDRWQEAIDGEVMRLLHAGDIPAARARIALGIGLDQPLRERR